MSGQSSAVRSTPTRGHRVAPGHAGDARTFGHVRELALPLVAIEKIGIGRQPLRSAVDRQPLPRAVDPGARLWRCLPVEPQVVRDKEIEPAVAIDVDERAARPPAHGRRREPGRGGRVFEAAIPAIAIEHVLSVVGHEQIEPAVVVVVAGTDARRPTRAAQPGALGDVLERAVALVPIEAVGRRLGRWITRVGPLAVAKARAAQHERVNPAIAIDVGKGHAGAVGLEDESLAIDAAIDRWMHRVRRRGRRR